MASPSIFNKNKLSAAAAGGRGILVAATATPGTLIHTAVAGTTANTFDELWLEVVNGGAAAVKLTIEWGGNGAGDVIEITIPGEAGLFRVIDGIPVQNGLEIRAFAGTTNILAIYGFVNEIRP